MGNTGKKNTLTLAQVNQSTGAPTGEVKNNVIGDPDYVPPVLDLVACPITYDTTCPLPVLTVVGSKAVYEFMVPNSVLRNPAIAKVKVVLFALDGVTEAAAEVFTLPHSSANYFSGSLTAAAGNYTFAVVYLNGEDGIVAMCDNLKPVTLP